MVLFVVVNWGDTGDRFSLAVKHHKKSAQVFRQRLAVLIEVADHESERRTKRQRRWVVRLWKWWCIAERAPDVYEPTISRSVGELDADVLAHESMQHFKALTEVLFLEGWLHSTLIWMLDERFGTMTAAN